LPLPRPFFPRPSPDPPTAPLPCPFPALSYFKARNKKEKQKNRKGAREQAKEWMEISKRKAGKMGKSGTHTGTYRQLLP